MFMPHHDMFSRCGAAARSPQR